MKHLGDISKIHGAHIEPVDLITFGSPCQDLSVAGKRAGLKHETNGDEETTRSGLFMEAVRIIKEMREATNGKYPRFALWENVPGAFSSNKGEDFRVVLEELIKIVEKDATMPAVPKAGWAYADCYSGHGWSLAYRVLNSQYIRTAQRRKRIFLVADFGGERAKEILFKRESLRGYFTPGQQAWQGAAAHAESGSGAENSEGATGSNGAGEQVAACLYAAYGTKWNGNAGAYNGENFVIEGAEGSQSKCYGISSYDSNAMKSDNPHSGIYEAETSRTLDLNGGNPACNQGGVAIVEPIICAATQQGGAEIRTDDKAPTITAAAGMSGNNQPFIAMADSPQAVGIDTYNGCETGEVAATLGVNCGISTGRNGVMQPIAFAQNQRGVVKSAGFKSGQGINARGFGWGEEQAPTLGSQAGGNSIPSVAYGMSPVTYNGVTVTSPDNIVNPKPGDPCHTLGTDSRNYTVYCLAHGQGGAEIGRGKSPCLTCNHEQPIIFDKEVYNSGIGATGGHYISEGGPAPTLRSTGHPPGICFAGVDSRNATEYPEQNGALQASCCHNLNSNNVVREHYIVRRLTPIECARLQGFPDSWGELEEKDSFTEEEYKFWLEVRNTHAAINGKTVKDYTEKQVLRWYNKLHTDSAEYKMWGNGIALPCALYVMEGIWEALKA